MKSKGVKCNICGSKNWSGTLYCEKCSGDLYHNHNHNEEKATAKIDEITKIFKLWK